MKQSIDLARKFLSLAARDSYTLKVLLEDEQVADEAIGFHAQQAVEKCVKQCLFCMGLRLERRMLWMNC